MKIALFDPENWREIGATLARNKTRTFLTAFGIFWGTAMLTMLWGGANGFEGIMRRNFAGFATNMGAVFNGTRSISYKGFNKGSYWNLTTEDVEKIRQVAPAIEHSSVVNSRSATFVYNDKSKSGSAMGIEADYTNIMQPVVYEGRFINATDVAGRRKVAVVGRNIANELFGSESGVGKYVSINGIYFLVVGIAGQTSEASISGRVDDSVILPSSTFQTAFNWGNAVGFLIYTAPQGKTPSDNEAAIRRVLSSVHSIHPDDERAIGFMDISETFGMIDKVFLGIGLLALFVGAGSLLSGIIGIGNIMWIVVKERTHEFGIRRAIGAKPLDITVQVLSESILLTLVAGVAGVCFGCLVLGVADKVTVDSMLGAAGFQTTFTTAMVIVGLFFVFGTLAGTLPAIKAMKIKPIEALRDK